VLACHDANVVQTERGKDIVIHPSAHGCFEAVTPDHTKCEIGGYMKEGNRNEDDRAYKKDTIKEYEDERRKSKGNKIRRFWRSLRR
jgi:hypothetical protein